jgi:tRNA pseudouridine38-40 synthase
LRDGAAGQGIIFPKEEIEAEQRRPKHKVAVMIGYSGTGYKGMQISGSEKTIEGDLFQAFVKAGAISKANAEDPKKSSLVRCARTDKGVHAAGNMISLKLIVEDKDIVEKINAELSSQIRVWGIERTIGSFSCYQAVDSRWYEYLIPSHAFLPPHPSCWLAKQLEALADQADDRKGYEARQEEVKGFWEKVDEEDIKPILESIDEDIRWEVVKALQGEEEASAKVNQSDETEQVAKVGSTAAASHVEPEPEKTEEAAIIINQPTNAGAEDSKDAKSEASGAALEKSEDASKADGEKIPKPQATSAEIERTQRLRAATRRLRQAYTTAKRRYRIPAQRVERIQAALSVYVGTRNYHNYTIQKTFKDPSVKRHIKSFVVNPKPILIGDGPDEEKSEWLSLKVHGQSFMMHQIRKMVGMVTLLVRSGANIRPTMLDSFTEARYSIPKVPGLGLLLERPVFDTYNNLTAPKHGREKLIFSKYDKELEAFKETEIYQRIFREEEERNEFGRFFNHVDNFKDGYFLYISSMGLEATKGSSRKPLEESEGEGSGGEN